MGCGADGATSPHAPSHQEARRFRHTAHQRNDVQHDCSEFARIADIPPEGNPGLSVLKAIAVPDLMYQAGLIVSETVVAMPVYTFTAIVYFVLVLGVSAGVGWIGDRLPGSAKHRSRLRSDAAV